jgi:NAD(P)-dependent dehydrogenase (short-subunit alcohol dehydrogenase family)
MLIPVVVSLEHVSEQGARFYARSRCQFIYETLIQPRSLANKQSDASKAAASMFNACLRLELEPFGIKVID